MISDCGSNTHSTLHLYFPFQFKRSTFVRQVSQQRPNLAQVLIGCSLGIQGLVTSGVYDDCFLYRAEPVGPTKDAGKEVEREG